MAYNGSSHNVGKFPFVTSEMTESSDHFSIWKAGAETGLGAEQPPPVSEENKAAIIDASKGEPTGQHAPGRDGGNRNEEEETMPSNPEGTAATSTQRFVQSTEAYTFRTSDLACSGEGET